MTNKYTIYVDESGDANLRSGRWLCLCGIILEDDYARSNVVYQFDEFKKKYSIEDAVLHLEDIKRSQKKFSFLKDNELKTQFYIDLTDLISIIDFKIIGIVIDKSYLIQKYSYPDPPYHYALKMLIEDFVAFLSNKDATGKVCVEARNAANLDGPLEKYFKNIYENGTRYGGINGYGQTNLSATYIQRRVRSKNIKFFDKPTLLENKVNGLEIADLLCNPTLQIIKTLIFQYRSAQDPRPIFDKPAIPDFTRINVNERIILPRNIRFNWQP
jgi:hypothetical protein